jgi:hypothetical protein
VDKSKGSIQERFHHLYTVMSGQRFLQRQGLGNEVPFFICPFKPEDAVAMGRMRHQLVSHLKNTVDLRILEIDLYNLSIELLKARGIWGQILQEEKNVSKAELKELLQGVLDPETHLVPAIAEEIKRDDYDILFLFGIGEVFPYIRSHNVLNNLQSTAKDKPTIMFFPGAYTHSLDAGASLDLFGKLQDDKYYRAFNIYDYEA